MSTPADEHRRIAGAFTTTVEGVAEESWDQPAPVEGWVARDVVGHLVEWFPVPYRDPPERLPVGSREYVLAGSMKVGRGGGI